MDAPAVPVVALAANGLVDDGKSLEAWAPKEAIVGDFVGVPVLNAPNEVDVVPLLNGVLLVGVSVAAVFIDSLVLVTDGVLPNASL